MKGEINTVTFSTAYIIEVNFASKHYPKEQVNGRENYVSMAIDESIIFCLFFILLFLLSATGEPNVENFFHRKYSLCKYKHVVCVCVWSLSREGQPSKRKEILLDSRHETERERRNVKSKEPCRLLRGKKQTNKAFADMIFNTVFVAASKHNLARAQ